MKLSCARPLASLALVACLSTSGQAATVWDESTQGDLSNNRLQPTALAMTAGDNLVFGSVGSESGPIDRDFFSFSVPANGLLQAVVLLGNTSVSGSSSFLALQAGPQVTTTPGGQNISALLGFIHYDPSMIGQNLLPLMGVANLPLPAGTYSVWVQELSQVVPYGLNFVLSAVPEPGAGGLLLAGLAGLMGIRALRRPRR